VNYWMHNGFVRVDDEKMSKSLGNFFTIREVLKKYKAEVIRFFILRAQYRSPLNYSDKHLDDANQALTRLYTTLKNVPPIEAKLDWTTPYAQRFKQAMDDDFNTPEAMAVLFDLASQVNREKSAEHSAQLKNLANLLGLLEDTPSAFLQGESADLSLNIEELIKQRSDAKRSKNFAEADRIRQELLQQGIILEDSAQGTTWRRL
jgi:cysteinyl-tRNA synthetase